MVLKILFGICAAFLFGTGYLLGYSYIETAVFINIYLQAAIWGLSIAVLGLSILWNFRRMYTYIPWVFAQGYFLYIFVKEFFFLPTTTAFNKTMHGLQDWADALGVSYYEINVVLYVLVFISVVMVNIGLSRKSRRLVS